MLRQFASDPAAYRAALMIPAARGKAQLGDVMADFQRQDFAQLDRAFKALAAAEKPECGRLWLERTKGASKDTDLAVMLLWLLAFSPRSLFCQVGAADQDQADELRKAAKGILRLNSWLAKVVTIQAWSISNPRTDARCEIIAADVAGSHGARPDVLILNEFAHVEREEFARNLLDNASKVPHGVVVIATNAGFCPSWQWDLREVARTSPRWYFSAYQHPAPWLDAAEVQEAERRNPRGRFARLFRGEWMNASGDAIPDADLQAAIRERGPMAGDEQGWQFFGGLDLSVSHDSSALVIVGRHRTRRLRLAWVQAWIPPRGGKVDLPAIEEAVLAASKRFRRPAIYYDQWQAELMAQRCKARGVRVTEVSFQGKAAQSMATELIESFTSGRIDLYDDPALLRDLRRLRLVERPSGWKLDAPRTSEGHSDRAIALALAVLSAREGQATIDVGWWVNYLGTRILGEPSMVKEPDGPASPWGEVGAAELLDAPGAWESFRGFTR
jgi:hypothetical protein